MIILENSCFRLEIGENGCAKSLLHKDTGIQCLQPGVELPMFSVTQDRLYNNELKLAYPTQETTFPATGVRQQEERLIVSFALIPYEAVIRVEIRPLYMAFRFGRMVIRD